MSENVPGADWQVRLHRPRLAVLAQPIRAGDVSALLCETMLARENLLEDAEFQKIVPNQYAVELAPENYARNFQPIEQQLRQQWRDRLLNHLATTNSRQGRREYRFAGQVEVELHPAPDLGVGEARIRSRLHPDGPPNRAAPTPLAACLELQPEGKRWRLREGILTIGREANCDIALDLPRLQERPLVSGKHAYLHCSDGTCRLFDGTPTGAPSVNGTLVNGIVVGPGGHLLADGDILILAGVKPLVPGLESPGSVSLRFQSVCE